mgnify:CR=1 FL=1
MLLDSFTKCFEFSSRYGLYCLETLTLVAFKCSMSHRFCGPGVEAFGGVRVLSGGEETSV